MLEIADLSVDYYRAGRRVPALRDVSFSVAAGETLGLVGESGSGKSTVALAILRLIRAPEGEISSGRILWHPPLADGQARSEGGSVDLLALPEASMRRIRGRRIAMVFQDPFTALNPVMTVREQMEEILDAHADSAPVRGTGREGKAAAMAQSLRQVQLDPESSLRRYPHQLSGGQRQRVCIAMALLARPSLLIADEPTTALDVLVQREILDLLSGLQAERKFGMILITHNLPLVAGRAGRLVVMDRGRVVESGLTERLWRDPQSDAWRRIERAVRQLNP